MPASQCVLGSLHGKLSGSGINSHGLDGANRLIIENSAGPLNVLLLSLFVAGRISGTLRRSLSRGGCLHLGQNGLKRVNQFGSLLNFFSVNRYGRSVPHLFSASVNLFKLLTVRRSSLSICLGRCLTRSLSGCRSGALLRNLRGSARRLSGRSMRRRGNARGRRSRRRAIGARVFSSASAQDQGGYRNGTQGAQKAGPGGVLEEH